MELTIDEKMRLVQKMRAEEEARDLRGQYTRQYSQESRYAAADAADTDASGAQRRERLFFLTIRIALSICLFGGYLYLHYGHGTISGIHAEDVCACISTDGLWRDSSGEK